jgi:hypothetical protein
MKLAILATLGLLSSVPCLAAQKSDTWTAIRNDHSVTIGQPAAASPFGAGGFFNACIDGDSIRSLTPVATCTWVTERKSGGQDAPQPESHCLNRVSKFVSIPLTQVATVCARSEYTGGGNDSGQGSCLELKNISYQLPTNPVFFVSSIATKGQDAGDDSQVLFIKNYQIPACAQSPTPVPGPVRGN